MQKNKVEINSKDEDGNSITVYVTRPSDFEYKEAQKVSARVFKEAIKEGALLRARLDDYMEEQGLWNKDKDVKLEELRTTVEKNLLKIKKGGIKLKEAREAAVIARRARLDQTNLLAKKRQLDEFTVEGQAENARFDYLVYLCTKDDKNERVFNNIDDYSQRNVAPFAVEAASALAGMLYNLDDNWEAELPENKFLRKFNFVDDKLRLVNKDGKYVTLDDKLINEEGFYINEKGDRVDVNGNPIDEDGLPLTDHVPFLDDDGNPIVEDNGKVKDKVKAKVKK